MFYDSYTFEHAGHKFSVRHETDDDVTPPWKREDGHGPVSDWTRRAKAPGEMVLVSDRGSDRGSRRYYDFAKAVRIARRDGWDAAPYGGARGEKAHRAALADFNRLRAWCNDQWSYVGVIVQLLDDDGDPIDDAEASLWGVEGDDHGHMAEIARELAEEVLATLGRQVAA